MTDICDDILDSLSEQSANAPVPVPGGTGAVSNVQDTAAQTGDSSGNDTTASCPAPCLVTVKTRAGDIPLEGCIVECDGRRIGVTSEEGVVFGNLSACGGIANLKVIYQNTHERVKREEFTLSISDIDLDAKTATGGQARNFISKVQDVFGSGAGGFPGDLDFEDTYDGSDLVTVGPRENSSLDVVKIDVRMATISFYVPYVNQNDTPETIEGVTKSGGVLCMPTSGEMLAGYWDIDYVEVAQDGSETRSDLTRLEIMQRAYDRASNSSALSLTASNSAHWQDWANYRGAMQELVDSSNANTYSVNNGPSGGASESIPSAYADGLKDLLGQGIPAVTSTFATGGGHVMIVIGAVVKHDDEAEWLIFNDPNGTLASTDSIYGNLDIQNPVGLRGNSTAATMNAPADVRAVQEVLTRTGHYNGALGAAVDETNADDPTIAAIRAFQGAQGDGRVDPGGAAESSMNAWIDDGTRNSYSLNPNDVENERNQSPSYPNRANDRGRHVYYNGNTEGGGTGGRFRLKGEAWTCVIEPDTPLTTDEIRERLNTGTQ